MQRTYQVPPQQKARQARPAVPPLTARLRAYLPHNLSTWLLIIMAFGFFLISMTIAAVVIGTVVIYGSGRILPGVSVSGVYIGGQTVEDAAATLQDNWSTIRVRDGQTIWT